MDSTMGFDRVLALKTLENAFKATDSLKAFSEFTEYFARWTPKNERPQPYVVPCLPVIGKQYKPGGVLVYAAAQNLNGHEDKISSWKNHFNRQTAPKDPLLDEIRCSDVWILPWEDKILPATISMWLLANQKEPPRTLDALCETVTVSNFFKFSFCKDGKDLNPKSLKTGSQYRKYFDLTLNNYVRHELEQLKPSTIVAFKPNYVSTMNSLISEAQKHSPDVRVFFINDPAWIFRGMGGVYKPGRSWHSAIKTSKRITKRTIQYAEKLLDEIDGRYTSPKIRDRTLTYLLYYYLEFLG